MRPMSTPVSGMEDSKRRRVAGIVAAACWRYLAFYVIRLVWAMHELPELLPSWA